MRRRLDNRWPLLFPFLGLALVISMARGDGLTYAALPAGLHVPDGTGVPLDRPALAPDGPPLIVSNSPEQITSTQSVVVLCRARPASRRFRVFFHHQNATTHSLQIGLAVSNLSAAPIQIYVARNSQSLPKAVTTSDPDPASAGRRALWNWMTSRQGADDADGNDVYLGTIPPGGARFFMQPAQGHRGGGETVTGMYDFAVRFNDLDSTQMPTVEVTTLAYRRTAPDAAVLAALPLSVPDPVSMGHCRGMFGHDARQGSIAYAVTDATPRWLDLGGPASGAFNHSLTGEYETAADSADADALRDNSGNYGVTYDLNVSLSNPQPKAVCVHCLMNAAGGPGYSALMVDDAGASGPLLLPAFGSWDFQDVTVGEGETRSLRLRFSLPGGSSGAHRLFFWPVAPDDRPVISKLDPASFERLVPGATNFFPGVLHVHGSGFAEGAVVFWGDQALPTKFVSDEELDATLGEEFKKAGSWPDTDLGNHSADTAIPVTVLNPGPQGKRSRPAQFTYTVTIVGG